MHTHLRATRWCADIKFYERCAPDRSHRLDPDEAIGMNDATRYMRVVDRSDHVLGDAAASCPTPRERRYLTRSEAHRVRARMDKKRRKSLRLHHCGCGFWHFTPSTKTAGAPA